MNAPANHPPYPPPSNFGAFPAATPATWTPPSSLAPRAPQRNVALIVVGSILLLVALGAGAVFLLNLYQYLTIEDRWADERFMSREAREFGVMIIQRAAMKRMVLFGPVSALSGIVGLVLGVLGLRKR